MLDAIFAKYGNCNKCNNCISSCKVFGSGNPNAKIMVVGEGPGATEVETKIPFTGASGKLLDEAFRSVGIAREDIYVTNAILCRTNEKNRTPSWEESQNCAVRLDEEMNIVKPNVIVMAGSVSLQRFLGEGALVGESHGSWFMDFKPPYARLFSIRHPAWVLYSNTKEEQEAKMTELKEDMETFKRELSVANFNLKREEKCF